MRMLLSAGSMPRASNGQTRIPLVATRFPGRETTFPVLPTFEKASSCGCKECFLPGFHHAVEVSEDPEVTHVFRHVQASKQASNGQGGTRGGTVLSDSVHAANPPGRPPVRVLNIRLPTILDALPARPRPSRGSPDGCYLVDPASSHMLVSKIKPCMCKYELIQTVKLRMAH